MGRSKRNKNKQKNNPSAYQQEKNQSGSTGKKAKKEKKLEKGYLKEGYPLPRTIVF